MATGDITISIAVEGGATKNAVIPSASRVLAMANADYSDNAEYQVFMANKFAKIVNAAANNQQEQTAVAGVTATTFTAAS